MSPRMPCLCITRPKCKQAEGLYLRTAIWAFSKIQSTFVSFLLWLMINGNFSLIHNAPSRISSGLMRSTSLRRDQRAFLVKDCTWHSGLFQRMVFGHVFQLIAERDPRPEHSTKKMSISHSAYKLLHGTKGNIPSVALCQLHRQCIEPFRFSRIWHPRHHRQLSRHHSIVPPQPYFISQEFSYSKLTHPDLASQWRIQTDKGHASNSYSQSDQRNQQT